MVEGNSGVFTKNKKGSLFADRDAKKCQDILIKKTNDLVEDLTKKGLTANGYGRMLAIIEETFGDL